jgi:D-glycero-D-manno-heptose 1,7-bisphosphate phosphatase
MPPCHGLSVSTVSGRGCFDESLGVWVWAAPHAASTLVESERGIEPRPALFLDRDGVIIEDPGYLCRAQDLQIIEGAAHLIALANRRGIPVVEITNQAGIGRGYYGWNDFVAVEEALAHLLAHEHAAVDAVLACPYHHEGIAPWEHPEHPARKPRPGMLFAAERLLHLDLRRSWIVGDRLTDLQAGYYAGLRGGLHVLTGAGRDDRPAVTQWSPENFELRLGDSIRDAEALLAV